MPLSPALPLGFSAFGLSLRANRPIPGLVPDSTASSPDTQIWLDMVPISPAIRELPWDLWYLRDHAHDRTPALRVWRSSGGAFFRLLYGNGIDFLVSHDGSDVWVTWPDSASLEDAATYLLAPVLGFVLRLRGTTCLHASAVATGRGAIALLGPAQTGKSTMAAAFCGMGHPVVADNVVALADREGTLLVQPAYPQVRLWPEAVALLYGSDDALPRLTPTWDKRALDLTQSAGRFQHTPLPLAAVYVLAARSSDAEPRIHSLRGNEALMTLVSNTYVSYLLDPGMREGESEWLARVVSSVPVRRVIPSTDPAQIARLCHHILTDCEGTAPPTEAP